MNHSDADNGGAMRLEEWAVSLRSITRAVGHPTRRTSAFAVALIAMGGCDSSDYEGPLEVGACKVLDAQKISGDAAPLGFPASEAIARYPVSEHFLTFQGVGQWDPPQDTDLEVGILAADLSRVHWVKKAETTGVGPVVSVGSIRDPDSFPDPCPPALTFPVTMRFRSADGTFDEELRAEVWATAEEISWSTCLPFDKLRGRFAPPPAPEAWQSHVPHEFCFTGRTSSSWTSGLVQVLYKAPGYQANLAYYGFWSGHAPEPIGP